jgi:membrane-associated phospholipid phosphatase
MNKDKILQLISNVFHPLLSMVWATVILLFCSPVKFLPWGVKGFLLAEVAFYSLIVPSLIIILLARFGIVKNGVALRDRKDRILPLAIQVGTYTIQVMALQAQGLPRWALQFYWGALLLAWLTFVVSMWWKISAHASGNAAIATALLVLCCRFPSYMPLALPLFWIVITGLVCSIRLYLNRHTLAQVACGALAGMVCILVGGWV